MLVITRRVGERITIGSDVVIEVKRCGSQKVRLAIDAPRNIYIGGREPETATRGPSETRIGKRA